MNGTLERIHERLGTLGVPVSVMCRHIGLPQSTFAMWKKHDRQPKSEWIAPIAEYLKVSTDYLLNGGSPEKLEFKLSANEVEDFMKQYGFDRYTKAFKVDVIGRIAAGVPIEAITDFIGEEVIPASLSKTGDFFGLRIVGSSMEPRMYSGDVVIVRQQEDIESGQVAVVMIGDEDATCKKIEKHSNGIMLVPFNNKYEEKFFTNEEIEKLPVRILGRVVEVRGRL